MTSKVKGNEGIEFPDSTVQSSAAYDKTTSDARYVNIGGDTMTGLLTINSTGRPLSVRATVETNNWTQFLRAGGTALGQIGAGGGAATSVGGVFDFCVVAAPNQLILGAFNQVSFSSPLGSLVDGEVSCGMASSRWSAVYAVSGAINTSDARQKTPVRAFTANELAAAKALAKEIGFFKWLQTEKGPGRRDHCGITVQKVVEVMEANGLNAFDYAFVCHDNTPETSRTLESGDVVVTPAVDVYSLRPDQLSNFIMRGMEERIAELESKL